MAYTLDGNDLETTYGIRVVKSYGFLDFLKRKGDTEFSWPDSDGVEAFTDSTDIYYEPRTIKLDCVLVGSTFSDMKAKLDAFKTALQASGTRSLYNSFTGVTYTVYFKDGASTELLTKINAAKNICRFMITLIEPDPTM